MNSTVEWKEHSFQTVKGELVIRVETTTRHHHLTGQPYHQQITRVDIVTGDWLPNYEARELVVGYFLHGGAGDLSLDDIIASV